MNRSIIKKPKGKKQRKTLTNVNILMILRQKFGNILPPYYDIFMHQEDTQYLLYINKTPLPKHDVSNGIGYISFTVDDDEINVMFVWTTIRKQGIGHYLMFLVAFIGNLFNINKIFLDDDSNLAHNGSLYENLNCTYENEPPNPEMVCSPNGILSKQQLFSDKYIYAKNSWFRG